MTISAIKAVLEQTNSDLTNVTRKDFIEAAQQAGVSAYKAGQLLKDLPSISRGVYNMAIPAMDNVISMPVKESAPVNNIQKQLTSIASGNCYVPSKDPAYIAWGHSKDVETIVSCGSFFPTYIAGLSGNGKTIMVEQACAKLKREYIRVQISPTTDEDELIGGFRLIDGETVFAEGPVIKAMRSGAVLMIDEIDRGTSKIMCLQGVLEGKPVLIKKTGEVVAPAPGFTVIATGNTKGRGSDDGRFQASIIDEAFLERFVVLIDQPYPTLRTELRIIKKHMELLGCVDDEFAEMLANWSDTIRQTYKAGGIEDLIATRRLCHIVQSYSIFKDREKAVTLGVNRFDDDIKESFLDLYKKVDSTLGTEEALSDDIDDLIGG